MAAVFSVIAQSKGNPAFAWTLIAIALLVLGLNFYNPVLAVARARIQQAHRNQVARKSWPELLRFEQRFADFVSRGQANTFQYALKGLSQHAQTEFGPPDFLPDFFRLFAERQEKTPPREEADFRYAARELQQMVWSYNREYVQAPLERLRRDSSWRTKLADYHRADVERQIEDCRDRWVRFLDDFQLFLEKLNGDFDYDIHEAFGTYFERPQKL